MQQRMVNLRGRDRLVAIVAALVLVRVAVDWVLQAWTIPTRALWVDELVNFTWAWARAPYWYPHHLTWTPHAIVLLPMRLLPDDPNLALLIYRGINWLALPSLVAPALWHAGRSLHLQARLTVAAGAASLIWVWTTGAVARHNIWALAGLAWLLVDDWRTWRSWAGFAASLLYPHAAVFAALFTWWRGRDCSLGVRRWACPALVALAVVPAIFTVATGLAGNRSLGASFNNRMPETLTSIHMPLPIPLDSPKWPLLLTLATTLALAILLRSELRGQHPWRPVWWYAALLGVMGITHIPPLLSRYVAPIVLFSWLWVAPRALAATFHITKRTLALVLLAAVQATIVLPRDVFWEATPMPAAQAKLVAAALDPCVVEIGGSMIDILTSLDQLLAARLWRPAQTGCEIRLAASCHAEMMADYEPRFHRLFAPAGFSNRPPSVRFRPLGRGANMCPLPPAEADGCIVYSHVAAVELVAPNATLREHCRAAAAITATP